MTVKFIKQPVYEPESLYFTVPLKMKEGWECSYDTAGEIVRLDEEQMGNVCRDWVTVDSNQHTRTGMLCKPVLPPMLRWYSREAFPFDGNHTGSRGKKIRFSLPGH